MFPDALESIERALSTGTDLPRDAVGSLSALHDDAMDRFRQMWERLGDEEREALLDGLGEANEENIGLDFFPIYTLALSDRDDTVRELGFRLASEEANPVLLDDYLRAAIADPDPGVRLAVIEELSAYTLTAQVDDWPSELQEKLERTLVGLLHLPGAETSARKAALLSLSYLTTPQTEVEIRQAHLQPDLRDTAIEAMGRNCQDLWVPDIRSELRDGDRHLRIAAAQAAGELEDPGLVPDLIERLRDDDDDDVRFAAIAALGLIGGQNARLALSELLQSRSRELRNAARDAMEVLMESEDPFSGFR